MHLPRPLLVLAFSAVFALSVALRAQTTTTWTGATNSDWSNGSNWNNGSPFGPNSHAIITAGSNPAVLENGTLIGSLQVNTGGQLTFDGGQLSTQGLSFVGGTGTGSVTIFNSGFWNATGGIVVGDHGTGTIYVQGTNIIASNLYLGLNSGASGTLTLDQSGLDVAGDIMIGYEGIGRLIVTNGGFGGNVRIGQGNGQGWLTFLNNFAFNPMPSGTITVDLHGTLNGNDAIDRTVTVESGGHIAAGDTYTNTLGQLRFDNTLTLGDGSSLDFTLSGTQATYLSMGSGAGLTIDGEVTINLGNFGDLAYGTYTLLDFASVGSATGANLSNFTLGNTAAGFDFSLQIAGSQLQAVVTATAIPEPSTYAALAGAAALGLAVLRRRRINQGA